MTPPHARFSAQGAEVTIDFSAPPDDAAHIGEALGLLPAGTMEAFLVGPEELLPTDEQVAELARAPALEDYLLEHVGVRQGTQDCEGSVEVATAFLDEGARFTFVCDQPVTQVDVRLTILQDIDPAYDTFGVDGTIWTVLFSASSPEHTWDAEAASEGSGVPVEWVMGLGGTLAIALLWWVWSRRTRHLRRTPRDRRSDSPRRQASHSREQRRRTAPVS